VCVCVRLCVCVCVCASVCFLTAEHESKCCPQWVWMQIEGGSCFFLSLDPGLRQKQWMPCVQMNSVTELQQDAGSRGKKSGARAQEPGLASERARSNGPCEARRHKDSVEEVELAMCNMKRCEIIHNKREKRREELRVSKNEERGARCILK